jgi:Concanavalin A-like lectin/glucanases superfamily/Ig-like domain CHU_C associated/Pregnancy-associated plasma protein-A
LNSEAKKHHQIKRYIIMKMLRPIVYLLFLLFSYLQGKGQQIGCGTDELLKQNSALKLQLLKLENERQKAGVQSLDMTTVYTIPVVFHVYHLGEAVGTGSNVSDAAIQDIVSGMNTAFRAQNYFASSNDVKIQFALASYNSNCQSTNGIVRVDARSISNYQANGCGISDYQMQDNLRNLSSWDANSYINIRIVHNMPTYSGFAWFLGDIFCVASTVSINPSGSLSAFWAHEMGHSMNLYHTFEGDGGNQYCPPNNNPETEGDRISDTDPHKQNDGCNFSAINSCTNMPFGNVLKNIMSYSCSDRFTPKQVERMRFALINYRASLINSVGLTGPSVISSTNSGSRCGAGAVALSASGCTGTYNWYAAASGGSSLGTGANFTTPSINITTLYYVDCTVGSCVSSRVSATATVTIISAPTINSPAINSGQTATLTASNCTGIVKWYNQQTGGTLLFTGNPYTTAALSTSTTYYASCTVNNCESTTRGSGAVTVNCTPPTLNQPIISIGQSVILTATGCSGGTINWYSTLTGGSIIGSGTSFSTPILNTNTNYYADCTIGNCTSQRNISTVIVNCILATNLFTDKIEPTSAGFWYNCSNNQTYKVLYRKIGANSWTESFLIGGGCNPSNHYVYLGRGTFLSSTNYEWKIVSYCSGNTQETSIQTFSTVSCDFPTGLTTSYTLVDGAAVKWTSPFLNHKFEVRYKKVGQTQWNIVPNVDVSGFLCRIRGLDNNSQYEWQVRTICGSETPNFSNSAYFTTGCVLPGSVFVSNKTTSNAIVNWSTDLFDYDTGTWGGNHQNIKYEINWKKNNESSWQSSGEISSISPHSYTISNLNGNQVYDVRVRTICATNIYSDFSVTSFMTPNCTSIPSAPAVSSTSINSGQTATLTASNCAGTVKWYNQQTGGTLLFTGNAYTTDALTTTTNYYATCTVSGCESTSRGSATVTVTTGCTPPVAPTLPQMGSSIYQSFTLNATGCAGTVKWFLTNTDVNPVFTGNPYTTPLVFANKTYYASCTLGSCESTRSSTTLNILPCPSSLVHGTGTLISNLYQGQAISSQKDVANRTFYRASNSITLSAGFQAGANELFLAEIGSCLTMPESGLAAYYPFNSGSVNDESGNNNHATNNGATVTVDRKGVSNSAFYFNGTNAWLNTPMVQANLTGYTVSAWVKPEFTANQEYVILQNRGTTPGSGRSLTLHYQASTNSWGFAVDGDGLYTGIQAPSPNTTNWVHVVGVWSSGGAGIFNASQFRVYVSGVLVSASSINGNTATVPIIGAGTVAIGRHQAWNSYFKGAMDDIRIYNRALTDAEVQNIYLIER